MTLAPPVRRPHRGPSVALASIPGSGNSWSRYVMEGLTGVFTGTIYDDVTNDMHTT